MLARALAASIIGLGLLATFAHASAPKAGHSSLTARHSSLALIENAGAPKDHLRGVAPGETVGDVQSDIGQPLLTQQMSDGSLLSWNRTDSRDAYMLLCERGGRVCSVRVFISQPHAAEDDEADLTDPYGVTLGDSVTTLHSLRGEPQKTYTNGKITTLVYVDQESVAWTYDLVDNYVFAVTLYPRTISPSPSPSSSPSGPGAAPRVADPRDGSTIPKAIVIRAADEGEGVHFERYLSLTLPGCDVNWKQTGQALVHRAPKVYDHIYLQCPATSTKRSVFFDITGFFGKFD